MQLSHYLRSQSILLPLRATTKEEVLKELVDELCRREVMDHAEGLWHSLVERERVSSTFLPMGVAVPHARVPDISDIHSIIGIAPSGVQDSHRDSNLVAYLFFLFFSPMEEKAFGNHLKLLARVAAVFSDPALIQEMVHMQTADEVLKAIQQRERQIDRE